MEHAETHGKRQFYLSIALSPALQVIIPQWHRNGGSMPKLAYLISDVL